MSYTTFIRSARSFQEFSRAEEWIRSRLEVLSESNGNIVCRCPFCNARRMGGRHGPEGSGTGVRRQRRRPMRTGSA